ncbi:TonB family protein [Phenylobacterium sp.]|uniref:TonB family protein n=1 Tax=Phenylobacterium sp. TaxID=1871053 RepID=UPI0025F062ED|nr:TonB family protein [Phenylobacterium sp.]
MLSVLLAALLQAASAPPPTPAAPGVITNPDWQRVPTAEDISRYYPKAALEADLAGRAVLSCTVSAEGRLVGCSAATAWPEGAGFGEAALAMSEVFRMRPETRDGQAVAGGTVRIPIRFLMPANLRSAPVRARHAEVVSEIIELDCRFQGQKLDNCFARGGSPKASEVALKVAGQVTLPTLPTRRQQGRIVLPLVFTDASGAFAPPEFITQPRWRERPTPTEIFRAYPEMARAKGLAGNAVIDCKVEARGKLADCKTHEEDPAGLGFGGAALTLMPKFELDEVDSYGLKVQGRRIRVPVRLSSARPQTN